MSDLRHAFEQLRRHKNRRPAQERDDRQRRLRLEQLEERALLNAAPIAIDDTYTFHNAHAPLSVAGPGVLANDLDWDGDPLFAILEDAPAHGTVRLDGDGTFVYTPVAGFLGTDTFTYWAFDGTLHSHVTATVSVRVQPPLLLRDINRTTWPALADDAQEIVDVGGRAFFSADDGVHGEELWMSDGTEAGTMIVKDIWPGFGHGSSSFPSQLSNVGGTLFFSAWDPDHGQQLWKSDGTKAGTVMVAQIDSQRSDPHEIVDLGGTAYFFAYQSATGHGLWRSDGTADGTRLVKALASPQHLTKVGSRLYFQAADPLYGRELWKSDGTTGSTVMVKDSVTGPVGSDPENLTDVNGTLFFKAGTPEDGIELWKSDGTDSGTVMVEDIVPGPYSSYPAELNNVNGTLAFVAYPSGLYSGGWLWKSNGTAVDTEPVEDAPWEPYELTVKGGHIYFFALYLHATGYGNALWRSNLGSSGTTFVKELSPYGYAGSGMLNCHGTLYFSTSLSGDSELWRSDGTAGGTHLVHDIRPGTFGSTPATLTCVGTELFFTADDGEHGRELWFSDGTAAGTRLPRDINTDTVGSIYSPTRVSHSSGTFFFAADDGASAVTGGELHAWVSDGTPGGTVPLTDAHAQPIATPRYAIQHGGIFYFQANTVAGPELFKSDGTSAGTVMIDLDANSASRAYSLVEFNGQLYFFAFHSSYNWGLWKYDGTTPTFIRSLNSPDGLFNASGTLFFVASAPGFGTELWSSDGTSAGTTFYDIEPGNGSSNPQNFTELNGTLMFTARTADWGNELWTSDGTLLGTFLVKDIKTGSLSSNPQSLTNAGGTLYFSAEDPTIGRELWKSDGTFFGTAQVKDIRPNGWSSPEYLVNVDGTLYFAANDGTHGVELWKSIGGTADGTSMVKDIWPGSSGSYPRELTDVNGILYYSAYDADGGRGRELCKSDGTPEGTVLVADIHAGPPDSVPRQLTVVGRKVFFFADTYATGEEPWMFDTNRVPTDLALSPASVPEHQPAGTEVGTLSTTDPDTGESFTYQLYPGPGDTDNAAFTIAGDKLLTAAVFDVAAQSSYSIRVRTTDAGGLWYEEALTVSVVTLNNQEPTDLDLGPVNIDENRPPGSEVGMFTTTDPNVGDTFVHALAGGPGDADNSWFIIAGDRLLTAAVFDFETKPFYSIRVRTTDQGGLWYEEAFVIGITDVNDAPSGVGLAPFIVAENQPALTMVGILTSADQDTGDTFSYALVAGSGDADNGSFMIAGDLVVTTAVFDHETQPFLSIRVRSTDQGGRWYEEALMVIVDNVNETPADIALAPMRVPENEPSGTEVGTLTTTDVDAGNTFTYALVAGIGDVDNAAFWIAGDKLLTAAVFDYETKSSYRIRVRTTDQDGLSYEEPFTIRVMDLQESAQFQGVHENEESREMGAGRNFFASLDPTYPSKHGSGQAWNDWLLARDVRPKLLFGSDIHGHVEGDESEFNLRRLTHYHALQGSLDWGWGQ